MFQGANNLLAFISGWIVTTVKVFFTLDTVPFLDFITKLLGAVVIGALGGLGTMLMKDCYIWLKRHSRTWLKNSCEKIIIKLKNSKQ